jgi:hypothetical protein
LSIADDGAAATADDDDDDDASRWPIITFAIDTANAITTRAMDARRRTGKEEAEAEAGGRPTTHPPESADDELVIGAVVVRPAACRWSPQTKNNSVVLPCVIFCRGHRWDIPRYVVDTLKKLYIT